MLFFIVCLVRCLNVVHKLILEIMDCIGLDSKLKKMLHIVFCFCFHLTRWSIESDTQWVLLIYKIYNDQLKIICCILAPKKSIHIKISHFYSTPLSRWVGGTKWSGNVFGNSFPSNFTLIKCIANANSSKSKKPKRIVFFFFHFFGWKIVRFSILK